MFTLTADLQANASPQIILKLSRSQLDLLVEALRYIPALRYVPENNTSGAGEFFISLKAVLEKAETISFSCPH